MNRIVLGLVAGLFALALSSVACGTAAPTLAPSVAPSLAPAPPVAGATEVSPAVPTAPIILAPTTSPTASGTSAPIVVATPSAPTTPGAGTAPTTAPTRAPTAQAQATPAPGAACRNNSTFVSDVTVPDGSQFAPGQQFTKTWRIRNSGTCAWTDSYQLVFVRGTNMAPNPVPLPAAAAGATVDVQMPMTAPATPASAIGFYRMRAPNGTEFGQTVWASIRVATTPVPAPTVVPNFTTTPSAGAACINSSIFVADVTFPDNTPVAPGQQFVKTWRLRNSGTCAWDGGYTLAFERGTAMSGTTSVPLPAAAPGATVDVSVPLTAPTLAGTITSVWRPKAPNGTFFGQAMWAIVRVGPGTTPAPTATP